MRELTPENTADYLRETGHVPRQGTVNVRALGGGVSNVVLRVEPPGMAPFVLKQARERLRTEALWVSRLDRIWTERAALELLGSILPEGTVPRVLFSDEPNYLFAMTSAPDDAVVWKASLLAGETDPVVARRAGELLGTVHSSTRDHRLLTGRLADNAVFEELRIDPFYRTIAQVHPEIAPQIQALIASMSAGPQRCLVLGDFSPKNILVHTEGLTLVDFETAHAGDPSYDVGFFLSHLWLKALRASGTGRGEPGANDLRRFGKLMTTFMDSYVAHAGSAAAPLRKGFTGRDRDVLFLLAPPGGYHRPGPVLWHLNACALARVDGKSPVDYLDDPTRETLRRVALDLLSQAPTG
ncbi:MAG: aminoglycoside phosphotransferase family protein [Isosphaeraceae bacterium]